MRHYLVASEESGQRLDHYIALVKPDLTRSFIQKLIKNGHVFVNQKKQVKTSFKVSEGDELIVDIPSIKEIGIHPEDIPLEVIYEDADMLVINKPAGMVVHPTDHGAHVSGTLVNAVLAYSKDSLSGIGGEKRPGIVHRLDKDTSGLIMVAKNDRAHHSLSKQIHDRKVTKHYLALLKGRLSHSEGSIEAPLEKSHGDTDVHISNRKKAKYALTHYKVLEEKDGYSLVDVQIITGRTHQIRVHFASIGHSVCGDSMYGDKLLNETLKNFGLTRQFLHAVYLKFRLPSTDQPTELNAPLPDDLKKVLNSLGFSFGAL